MEEPKQLLKGDALLPLPVAARICFAAVHGQRVREVADIRAELARLAAALAARLPLYARADGEPLGRRLAAPDPGMPPASLHVPRAQLDAAIRDIARAES
ncbi:MAG TPA: hypothetical protein VM489_13760 [Burkholderiales bacterium]|nr:hypothetical protein [Burkholderiales bacterium]